MVAKSKRQSIGTLPSSNGHAPTRAVLYARVSSEEQRERQTIQIQIDYAQQQSEREGVPLVKIYRDEGVSGTIPFGERPAGKRLLEDARRKQLDVVWVFKVDRLGRADLVSHVARHHLETLGVGLRSLTEPFDTSTPQGRFMFGIFASYASLERSNFLERSAAGTARLVRTGQWVSGIVPYGYRRGEDRYLHVNEECVPGTKTPEAEVVRMIYRWAAERQSTLKIANKLNDMGIPAHYAKDNRQVSRKVPEGKRKVHTSGKWQAGRIGNMIHNTTYMGVHFWGKRPNDKKPKELIRREVPPIVSPELWQKAQEALKLNFRFAKRHATHDYLLSGLLRCGLCGRNLTGATLDGARKQYYYCNGHMSHVKAAFGACSSRYLPMRWVENLVWDELKDWILNHANLEEIITDALREQDQQRQESETALARIQAEVEMKDEERDRIVTAYRKGLLSDRDLERQLTTADEEQRHLKQAADELEQRHNLHVPLDDAVAAIRQQLAGFRKAVYKGTVLYKTKRQIVEMFVKEVRSYLRKGETLPETIKETIPLRPDARTDPNPRASRRTIWTRTANGSGPTVGERGVQVTYNFPFPPKPQDMVHIANHTGRGSSRKPA